jgi:teichuronic acid biosynthesis glycosyltransferase TuaG
MPLYCSAKKNLVIRETLMKSKNPLISVIVPTYNRKDLLKETIDSVLGQTFNELELIIVDNYSDYDFFNFIETFNDDRIRPFQNKNEGIIAVSRNYGLRKAQGEYIAFLDSDDLWYPEKLEKQLRFLELNPQYHWVYCGVEDFDNATGKTLHILKLSDNDQGNITERLIKENIISSTTPLIKKSVFDEIGVFNERRKFRAFEDWELWLRIAAKFPVGLINEVLTRYRIHQTNTSWEHSQYSKYERRVEVLGSVIKHFPDVYIPLLQMAVHHYCIVCSKELYLNGDIKAAAGLISREINQTSKKRAIFYWLIMFFKIKKPW